MEKIKNMLNFGKCLKLICGAGNEDAKEIEKLAFVYAKAGFNMIDLCAKNEVIKSAQKGILRAKKENEMLICTSVGLKNDIHLTKAVINKQKCILCKKCAYTCSENAIFFEDENILIDEKKCIGCAKCVEACPNGAILTEHKYKTPCEMLLPLLSEKTDCVEFHCSVSDVNLILSTYEKIKTIYKGIISICLDRSKLSDDEIIKLLKTIQKEEIIIQADGNPMSGGEDNFGSTLQSVAFAQLIRRAEINSFLILSGGTNSKTSKLAKECNVKIDGVALGSFARKLVKENINSKDFWENEQIQNEAISKAKHLAQTLLAYL